MSDLLEQFVALDDLLELAAEPELTTLFVE